jgi:hypothetical protein
MFGDVNRVVEMAKKGRQHDRFATRSGTSMLFDPADERPYEVKLADYRAANPEQERPEGEVDDSYLFRSRNYHNPAFDEPAPAQAESGV